MSKKLVHTVSLVLVLGLAMTSAANAADPNLVGWWRLDERSGTTARDSSGNGNHGTLKGNPQWGPGKIGGALEFNGSSGYVEIPFSESLRVINQGDFTITAWFKPDAIPTEYKIVWQQQDDATAATGRSWLFVHQSNEVRSSLGGNPTQSGFAIEGGTWYHGAVVVTEGGANDSIQIYVNGGPEGAPRQDSVEDSEGVFYIGCHKAMGHIWDGQIDDVRIYSRALTQEEIAQVMIGVDPALASDPNPADTATDVPREAALNWTAGEYAGQHDVYFGASFDDVNNATNLDPIGPAKVYRARQAVNSYAVPETLDFGQTYYWRIDEVNAPPTSHVVFKGDVWSFTVEPVAYPIASQNITATASSSFDASTGPENTINGSGLDDDDLHSVEQADIWLTDMTAQPPIWIQYEFDKVYKLHEMWVWNFNQVFEVIVGFGLKDVTIEYSANGTDWTELAGVPEFAQAPGIPGYAHNTTVDFGGVTAKYVKITANDNWGFLTQYGLSEVRFFYIPVWATEPEPASGATGLDLDTTLGFRAGREAAKHDVYLSTDEQAVIDGTAPVTAVSQTSYGPLSLDLGQTYYWRVDEVNEAETPTTWQGDIWDFATQEYFVLEDFEAYDDYEPNRIFDTWIDGWGVATNGSTIGYPNPIFVQDEHFVETTTTHGGGQSTPLFYDNIAGVAFSEAARTVDTTKDWTQAGVKTLTLWFYGDWTNAPGQVYVKIDGVKVTYDGDPGDIQVPAWHQWDIELASLAGVNLRNVNQITIGVDGAGSGVVFFDDIRLYPTRCVASRLKPQADMNDDCVVDYQDIDILSSDWLVTDDVIATVVPSEANKELHLQFDGSLLDSSPNGRNGYIMPATAAATYVTGKMGQAIYLDGTNYVEMTGWTGLLGSPGISVTAWIRTTSTGTTDTGSNSTNAIVGWGPNTGGQRFGFRVNAGRLRTEHHGGNVQGDTNMADGEWHHVAVTVEADSTVSYPSVILYLDGRDDTRPTTDPDRYNITVAGDVSIGRRPASDDRYFQGLIDDLRIYSRTLSGAEIAYLADATPGDGQLYVPVPSAAELYSGEPEGSKVIDLKDYAVLADQWLDEQLWPTP